MEPVKQVVCEICGQPTRGGVDYPGAKVYHMECLKHTPEMTATREKTQKLLPDKAIKD